MTAKYRAVGIAAALVVAAFLFSSAGNARIAVGLWSSPESSPQGGATELRGKVARADGQVVWIAMESDLWPRAGDPVKLEQMVSGIAMAMGGEWVVAEVTAEFVRAEPGPKARGNPARDYVALIQSANPQRRPAAATGTGTGGAGTGGVGGTRGGGGGGTDPIDLDEASALYDSLVRALSADPSREEIIARASAGDPEAQTQVGIYYHDGVGVPQNHGEAVAWFRRAADQGHARGQRTLGYMYQSGLGVSKDLPEAIRLYRLAAAQGFADAHNDLGIMYQQGWGVAQDDAQAIAWFRSGAELGNAWAFVNLAEHYESGRGVAPDRNLAIENYKAGARLGNTKAQDWLRREGIEWRQ